MLDTKIPYDFICEHFRLTWFEALWGYEHQLIDSSVIIQLAENNLHAGSNNPIEIELLLVNVKNIIEIKVLLKKLANAPNRELEKIAKKKWLFLKLAWLFKIKQEIEDPLQEVEVIYADFDYPPEVENFVRYMPAKNDYDPSVHSKSENIQHLYNNWQHYLNTFIREIKH